MLRRKAQDAFRSWLEHGQRKALLVKGARQVGKSYLAGAFARESFENVVEFDLLENARARESFGNAVSAEDLFMRISVEADSPLVPGRTAILIDEVQECPNVVTLAKYLVQRDDYRYILTGSLLGVKLGNIDSVPVGYVTQVEMFPLDFEEFCWAAGVGDAAFALARESLSSLDPLPDYLYDRLLDLFHRYLIVGGMPDAVNVFLETNNIDEVRNVHANLRALYRDDITKHAPEELRLVIRDIFDLIPSEAAASNRRFRLSSIQDVKRYSQVTQHFLWLTNAGVALPVYNVSAPISPLLVAEQRNLFKLFYLDAGLLASSYPKRAYEGLLDGRATMNFGAVYEAFVAQELAAHGFALRYFTSKKIGELDFVVERADGAILAIEVKSGGRYLTHAALDNALAVREYTIDEAYVFAEANVKREGGIVYTPVFLAGLLDPMA